MEHVVWVVILFVLFIIFCCICAAFDEEQKGYKWKKERYKWNLPAKYDRLAQWQRAQVRNQYIEEQDLLCYYCEEYLFREPPEWVTNKPLNLERVSLEHPIHLHHCHQTGYTIGAVHAYCNAALWQYHGE